MSPLRSERNRVFLGAAGVALSVILFAMLGQTGFLGGLRNFLSGLEATVGSEDEVEMRARKLQIKSAKDGVSHDSAAASRSAGNADDSGHAVSDAQIPYRLYLLPADVQWQTQNPGVAGSLRSGLAGIQRSLSGCIALRAAASSALTPFSVDAALTPHAARLVVTGLAMNIALVHQPEVACLRDRLESMSSADLAALSAALAAPLSFRIVVVPVAAGPLQTNGEVP